MVHWIYFPAALDVASAFDMQGLFRSTPVVGRRESAMANNRFLQNAVIP